MKPIKIPAIVAESECLCGRGVCRHYDCTIDYKEVCSYLCNCRTCNLKYKVRYNPITKNMFFIDKDTKEVNYKPVLKVYTTEIAKAHYEDEYCYDLAELDELEAQAGTGYEAPKVPHIQKNLKFVF